MKNKSVEEQAKEFVENNKFNSAFPADYMSFINGFRAGHKEVDKILLDMLNKYRSKLQHERLIKLDKIPNIIKVERYENYIFIIKELISKNGKNYK